VLCSAEEGGGGSKTGKDHAHDTRRRTCGGLSNSCARTLHRPANEGARLGRLPLRLVPHVSGSSAMLGQHVVGSLPKATGLGVVPCAAVEPEVPRWCCAASGAHSKGSPWLESWKTISGPHSGHQRR